MFTKEYKETLQRFCKNRCKEKIKALFIDVEIEQNCIVTTFAYVAYNKKSGTFTFKSFEELKNENIVQQASIVKKFFYEHNVDYVVMDLLGIRKAFYDALKKETKDIANGRVYKAWTFARQPSLNSSNKTDEVIITIYE